MVLKKANKIKEVGIVERAVPESNEPPPVFFPVINDEIVRTVIHQLHQLRTLINNRCSVAPRKNSSEQPGYLNVLFFSKQMRDGYGIERYERKVIVFIHFTVQKFFKRLFVQELVLNLQSGHLYLQRLHLT